MKKWILVFGLIFSTGIQLAYSQCATLDSLYRVLRVAKTDTNKVNTLNALAGELAQIGKTGQASFYTKQALRIAEKAGYDEGMADALTQVAYLDYEDLEKVSRLMNDFNKALFIYEEINDVPKIARTLDIMANYYFKALDEDSHREALEYFRRIATLRAKLGEPKKEAEAYEAMGALYGRLREDQKAIKAYKKAQDIKVELGLSTTTNERILAKYQRIQELEDNIHKSKVFQLTIGFGIALAVLLILMLTFWVQRNRAMTLLKRHKPELLIRKPKSPQASV